MRKEGSRRTATTPAVGEIVDRVSQRLQRVEPRTPRVRVTHERASQASRRPRGTRAPLFTPKQHPAARPANERAEQARHCDQLIAPLPT